MDKQASSAPSLLRSDAGAIVVPKWQNRSKNAPKLVRDIVGAYMSLLKSRSATLNTLSALIGALLATGNAISWSTTAVCLGSVWLVAAGCGSLNSYLDRDIDGLMPRTSERPLPSGKIDPPEKALYLGVLLVGIGLGISALWLNWLSTAAIAAGAGIYILVYTMWLKRKTIWGVVVGGLAGSCALLAGWFSITTSFGLSPLLFGILIFLWTPAHFWGLAIATRDQSERAGIPTLPLIHGVRAASRWAATSTMVLIPFSILPYALGILGRLYLGISLAAGLSLLIAGIQLYAVPTGRRAWTTFKLSSPYLAVIYLAIALDVLLS